ncbi:Uncharacterised protein [Vibrio cholerae]|nr:Uncharacterised protein [Vibrio cholerae]
MRSSTEFEYSMTKFGIRFSLLTVDKNRSVLERGIVITSST